MGKQANQPLIRIVSHHTMPYSGGGGTTGIRIASRQHYCATPCFTSLPPPPHATATTRRRRSPHATATHATHHTPHTTPLNTHRHPTTHNQPHLTTHVTTHLTTHVTTHVRPQCATTICDHTHATPHQLDFAVVAGAVVLRIGYVAYEGAVAAAAAAADDGGGGGAGGSGSSSGSGSVSSLNGRQVPVGSKGRWSIC